VIAEGYATIRRRPASASDLRAAARHANGAWMLVFQRPLATEQAGCVEFQPGAPSQIAFAIWDGSGRDRAAQKAVSAGLLALDVEA
jgi:complex iron-sulfur molybdoenzyme family reductase subunit gamma